MTTEREDKAPRFLRVPQVAEMFGVSEQKVYDLAAGGQLPAFKIGKAWRFPREELERFIADGLARTA